MQYVGCDFSLGVPIRVRILNQEKHLLQILDRNSNVELENVKSKQKATLTH